MGVFTVGRQVALEIDMPGWWLANASVDLNFRGGLYYDSSTANPRAATDFLSCTRASVGYAKNSDGTLTSFASNALRLGTNGLLIEDARTNEIFPSEDYSTTWTQLNITVTTNQAVAPNGATTMDKLDDGVVAGVNHGLRLQITGNTPNVIRTFSIFAKDIDRRYLQLMMYGGGTNGFIYCTADLQSGTISASGIGSAVTGTVFTSAAIESFTDGIYRIALTGSPSSTDDAIYFFALLSNAATGASPAYTGSNKSLYLWAAQWEVGAFPSSYIPTIGASATRAAENIITSGSLQTAINAATGSLVAQTDSGGGAGFAANIVDSNGTNLLGFDASNHALASMIGALATGNTANRTTQDKLGLAWNASGRSLVLNGGTVANDASAQTPSATQHIGSSGTANFAFAYIERLSAWTTKLADATLQGFTV